MSTAQASPTAPSPASANDAPTLPPLQGWSFPFAAENADAAVFFSALAQAGGGFYPLGANGLWHGGIHFDGGTGTLLNQDDGLRAIADGEVVAYRLNDTYPILEYPAIDGAPSRKAMYSSGFVLMHHRLALPADPKATGTPTEPPADEVLDFYTLAMHVACWKSYQAKPAMKRPRFWKSKPIVRVGHKDQQAPSEKDETQPRQRGANVRTAPVPGREKGHYTSGEKLGFLPQYSQVVIGEHRGPWGEITDIVSGSLLPVEAGGVTPATQSGSIGWIYLPEQDSITEPDPLDAVVILDPPIQLKAGELLGHLGEYQRYQDSTPLPLMPHRPLLHLECFAGPAFPAFLDRSRARAAQLPDAQKTLFVMPKGTRLIVGTAAADTRVAAGLALTPVGQDDGKSLWVKVQPQAVSAPAGKQETLTPSGAPVWVARASLAGREGCEAWSAFPLRGGKDGGATVAVRILSKAVLEKRGHAVDDAGVAWHEVDALTEQGSVTGWVSESAAHWESPFAWPGFELIDASDISVKDAYERQLLQAQTLLPGEKEAFQPAAEVVGRSALMAALDHAMDRNQDRMLDTQELGQAMATPSLAQGLSRIIGRYESEWGGDMARWQALTALMKAGEPIWKKELERIEKLRWWSEVGSVQNFPSDPKVYHIHPIGLVENFIKEVELDYLIKKIGDIISSGEGGYESYNTGTKGVPNGRVGYSFMHPPKGTVTNKSIDEIIKTESLSGLSKERMFATGKYQTTIDTLKSAKRSMKLTGNEKYDANMQERVFKEFLLDKAGGGALGAFVKKGIGTVDDAQYAASKEWASIAAPKGRPIKNGEISDGTLSYYESAANMANLKSSKELNEILEEIINRQDRHI
ncbi:MAG: hypothetical protein QJR11_05745 [Fulvimonas sp.]|nr:hypothetical protein [Fulvimonas sp.]